MKTGADDLDRLDWERDGIGWPHRQTSRFIEAAGLRWHVQRMNAAAPNAPVALLIHGTGASTHSWRGLMPLLAAAGWSTVAMDLPGHGFTSEAPARQLSLPGMAAAVAALVEKLGIASHGIGLAVGHSAGAAVAVRLRLDGGLARARIASLNGALLPLAGVAGRWFSPAAKLLAATRWAPRVFAWRAGHREVLARLLEATGSTLDETGMALYARLVRSPGHVAAALGMMANWDLAALERDLPKLAAPIDLIVGDRDRTIPPREARGVQARVANSTLTVLQGLGHLAHEERPHRVAEAIAVSSNPVHTAGPGEPEVVRHG